MRRTIILLFTCGLFAPCAISVAARNPQDDEKQAPSAAVSVQCYAEHQVGRLVMPVGNNNTIGYAPRASWGRNYDCFHQQIIGGFCEFPNGSDKTLMSDASIVVGAIADRDTIVSLYFSPSAINGGLLEMRSTVDPTRPWYEGAISHYDLTAHFEDITTNDSFPRLDIAVKRSSYSWANDRAQDIILFDYAISNIGDNRLRQMYIGFYFDGDVYWRDMFNGGTAIDDVAGFIESYPSLYLPEGCPPDSDLLNLGWTADNDGDMHKPEFYMQCRDAGGIRIIRKPTDSAKISFNWWTWNFGPQKRAGYRDLGSLWWWSESDWYYLLSNGERDYDQILQALKREYDPIWVQPTPEERELVLYDSDPRILLSIGPTGLWPGQTMYVTTAIVAGQSFHRNAHIAEYWPLNPEGWNERVYPDQLVLNGVAADWIYDNPGFDSDGDGYSGEFVVCNMGDDSTLLCDTLTDTSASPDTSYIRCRWAYGVADTVWQTGDGIPDFRATSPPPNPSTYMFVDKNGDTLPSFRVYPEVGRVRLVWNGAASENTPDWFSHKYDFEGYRVYIALDDRPASFSVVTSYDRENYNQWDYSYTERKFTCRNTPFTLEQLRCMHADSCTDTTWSPYWYTRTNPMIIPGGPKNNDRIIFFEPMGDNRSIFPGGALPANTGVKKVYPYATKPPHVHPDSIAIYYPDRSDTTYFNEDGYLKYYEYEYTFERLLPTVPYYVNVTAFDFGYPELELLGLEGDPAYKPKPVYALPSSDLIAAQDLGVFVYPNPYRLDADYRGRGYEGNQRWHLPDNKTRLIHFANLPPKCTLRILSIDGDLIRELEHDVDPVDYTANHETWDLITRNSQLVVSGLYYWTVEDDRGHTQIGKLVIIM